MLLVLSLACVELLKSAPKIITFTPYVLSACKKLPLESKPMSYPVYLYLLISSFFVILTAPNKTVKIESKTALTSKGRTYFIKNVNVYYFSLITLFCLK